MTIKELMDNPYAWLFLSFCTVAAFVFAIYTWFKSKRKKELLCGCVITELITSKMSNYKKLNVRYNNEHLNSLKIIKIVIFNSGNDVVEPSDFMPQTPLIITSNTDFLSNDMDDYNIYCTNPANKVNLKQIDNFHIQILFDCICIKENITITFLHTEKVSISGTLKNGKILKYNNYINEDYPLDVYTKIRMQTSKIVTSLLASCFIVFFIIPHLGYLSNITSKFFYIILILLFTSVILITTNLILDMWKYFCGIIFKKDSE